MKSVLMRHSRIICRIQRLGGRARQGCAAVDLQLGAVNRHSVIYGALLKIIRSVIASLKRAWPQANLSRSICGSVLGAMGAFARIAAGFAFSVYNGSVFLALVGRAAADSRWLR